MVVLETIHERGNRFAKRVGGRRYSCSIKSYMMFSNVANLYVKLNDNVEIIR